MSFGCFYRYRVSPLLVDMHKDRVAMVKDALSKADFVSTTRNFVSPLDFADVGFSLQDDRTSTFALRRITNLAKIGRAIPNI